MVYDFRIHSLLVPLTLIYGRLIPNNLCGVPVMLCALFPAALSMLLRRRLSEKAAHWGILAAGLTAYAGAYISSVRWLDDLFVNLAHPYNLLHHGRFSVSAGHMVNGTVEVIFYGLLTPFAFTRTSLIVADYIACALVGACAVALFAHMVRTLAMAARMLSVIAFATFFPLIQVFSIGYGNGLVYLCLLAGFYGLMRNRPIWIFGACAALPLLRPDAIVYSLGLILADIFIFNRALVRWWLLTAVSTAVYFCMIHLLYGFWVPVPISLKAVGLDYLIAAFPFLGHSLALYLTQTSFQVLAILFAVLFFVGKPPDACVLSRRVALGILIGTFPALILYRLAAMIGYNPTGFRYYAGFEMALAVVAAFGLASFLHRLGEHAARKGFAARHRFRLQPVFAATAAVLLIAGIAYETDASLHFSGGASVGIDTPDGDMKRLRILTFAGRYCDTVLPKGWRIATTEMDTFGYMSGREVLDLWGYSNRDIALSNRRDRAHLKINTRVLIDSNVEAYWLRSFDLSERNPSVHIITSCPREQVPIAVVWFPNTGPVLDQAGDLIAVFQKYDIIRIYQPHFFATVLLVRKDLTPQLLARLHATGHQLIGETPFNMDLLKQVYAPYREACR